MSPVGCLVDFGDPTFGVPTSLYPNMNTLLAAVSLFAAQVSANLCPTPSKVRPTRDACSRTLYLVGDDGPSLVRDLLQINRPLYDTDSLGRALEQALPTATVIATYGIDITYTEKNPPFNDKGVQRCNRYSPVTVVPP